jgi:hypothetical protein
MLGMITKFTVAISYFEGEKKIVFKMFIKINLVIISRVFETQVIAFIK